jgi:hypothetical protein
MKIRILMLSLLGLIFFNSCSSDSNSSNPTTQNLDPNTLLPKQIIITDVLSGNTLKQIFFYNGNKINYITATSSWFDEQSQSYVSNSGNTYFTYNGDYITKMENNSSSFNFTYQNGKISTCSSVNWFPRDFSIDFQYGSNGSVIRTTTYEPDLDNPIPPVVDYLNNLSNGLVSNKSSSPKEYNQNYYTSTNSVYKNIVGLNSKLSNLFTYSGSYNYNGYIGTPFDNNGYDLEFFTSLASIYNYSYIESGFFESLRYDYTYNEIDFPTSFAIENANIVKKYGTIIYY